MKKLLILLSFTLLSFVSFSQSITVDRTIDYLTYSENDSTITLSFTYTIQANELGTFTTTKSGEPIKLPIKTAVWNALQPDEKTFLIKLNQILKKE